MQKEPVLIFQKPATPPVEEKVEKPKAPPNPFSPDQMLSKVNNHEVS
jgi:hypothetical protein